MEQNGQSTPSRTDRTQGSEPLPRKHGLFRRILKMFLSFTIFACVGSGLVLLYLRSQALPVTSVIQTTEMVDVHGEVIDSFHAGQTRMSVKLSDISPWLIKATLAIEDHRFYQHFGIDPEGVARAVLTNLKSMSKEQGASTITQQLARNLYLNHDRTWERKFKEAMYTMQLEMHFSKDQILEMYLNQIYYGFSTYGIEAASEMYFGKNAKDLTLAESAMLAGIPKGPKYYSPYLNMENAKERQKLVLGAMAHYGDITQQQADAAASEPLQIQPQRTEQADIAPYFRDYVRGQAADLLGITEAELVSGGYRIYTTLDLSAQQKAEEAVTKELDKNDELQVALVGIDPRNGYIKAMIGGKNYADNQFNRVFATTRQPGSSFKPFVYMTALENGFTPMSKYRSEPTVFTYDQGRKTYTPQNFGNHYENQEIDMRKAIAKSDNIYAVHTIIDVGPQKVIDVARKMGVTSPLEPLPALALGSFPISPIEMASAYGVIANLGVRVEPTAIVRIEDAAGHVLYSAKPKEERVVDPAHAYVLTNLMESVFEEDDGTGHRVADLIKRPVAGKTGSTDTDAWMVGFTPELAAAVWVGYDRDQKIGTLDSRKAAPIFAEFLEGALEAVPPKMFPVPDGVVSVYIDPESGKLANDACPNSRMESFVQGTEPTQYCVDSKAAAPKKADGKESSFWNDLKRWWNE